MRKSLVAACGIMILMAVAAPALAANAAQRAGSLRASEHDDELFAISCVPKKGCLAGGKWFDSKAKATKPLAETSSGGSWTLHNPPNPKGSTVTAINGVSCVSGRASVCMAVGQDGTELGSHNYAALWHWSKWTMLKPPDVPSSTLDQLDAVSCASAVHCVITVHYVNTSASFRGASKILIWNRGKWTFQKVPPAPQHSDFWLYGLSCKSTSFCLAAGDYPLHGTVQPAFAVAWNGRRWKVVPSATPKSSNGTALSAVSCVSAKDCQVVGSYLNKQFQFKTVGESWNGAKLTLRPTPDVKLGEGSQLRGVSCLSASFCMATGTLAARWNGSQWKQLPFPNASPILSITYGTSCTSKVKCAAAGDYTSGLNALSLFVKWNGSAWTRQPGKNP